MPLLRFGDTPLCSLYRMLEHLSTPGDILFSYERQYFFHDGLRWLLCNIPDPDEQNPLSELSSPV